MSDAAGPEDVLDYWFGELDEGFAAPARRRRWFSGSEVMDEEIRTRFGPLIEAASAGELDEWLRTVTGTLAFVLVCDQFPRQAHRGTERAYIADPLALEVARRAVDQGRDRNLTPDQRAFLYMPFQHAESRVDQHTAVGLYSALRDVTPADRRQLAEGYLRHAEQHRDIVLAFGRFPHRNAVLGRASSLAEQRFLEQASSYGQ